jgi:hypothetical protein
MSFEFHYRMNKVLLGLEQMHLTEDSTEFWAVSFKQRKLLSQVSAVL